VVGWCPVPVIEVDRDVAERGKPGHVGGVEWVSAGGEMFKGGLGVDRLPEDDDVDHDAEAVELVFLPDLVGTTVPARHRRSLCELAVAR
jgi:hypothetical protein